MNTIWIAVISGFFGFFTNGLTHVLGRKKNSVETDSIVVKTALDLIKEITELKADLEKRLKEAERKIAELEKENRDLHRQIRQLQDENR